MVRDRMEVDNYRSGENPQGKKDRIRRRWGLGAYTYSARCLSFMGGPELAILYILSVLLPAKQKLVAPFYG